MPVTIGIDVGGSKIAAGVVDEDGRVVARRQIPTHASDPVQVVAGITKVATEMRALAPSAGSIGVGAAGLVEVESGIVLGAPNIAWENLHLRAMLEERVNLPVFVDNDGNAAAWGEALHGAGRDAGDQLMITVGTGIGGGLILNGALYRGGRNLGGEVGHMIVLAGGPVCACGRRGCLEAMASGTALARVAQERASDPRAGELLEDAGGDAGAITGEIVGNAALRGVAFAGEIVAETGRWLGIGLGSLVNLLDPRVVVVGGGPPAALGDLLLAPARAAMTEVVLPWHRHSMAPLLPAALGADAGLVGAAALARSLL